MHAENSLGKTLFALLFWEIIFDESVPHVFQTPFQRCPLDFGSQSFYRSRKEKFDAKLEEIKGWKDY